MYEQGGSTFEVEVTALPAKKVRVRVGARVRFRVAARVMVRVRAGARVTLACADPTRLPTHPPTHSPQPILASIELTEAPHKRATYL